MCLLVNRGVLFTVALALFVPAVNTGSKAWAHDAVNFSQSRYRAAEDDVEATVVVKRGEHGRGPASVAVVTKGGTATAGSDYTHVDDRVSFQRAIEESEAFIPLINDSEVEPLETVEVALESPSPGTVLAFPPTATLTIIDDDGPSRIGVETGDYGVFENRRTLDVWVLRAGADASAASVQYATVDGTGDQGARVGTDYVGSSGTVDFAPGQRAKKVTLTVIDNKRMDGDRTFSLELRDPAGAELMEITRAQITIRDDESGSGDEIPPYTAFHQPLAGETYSPRQAREFLVFMQDDENGSGMDTVEIALRKELRNGKCAWWTGKGFKRASCKKIKWSPERGDYFGTVAYFRISQSLKPTSKKAGIRAYTAFSRGTDRAGNVQTEMVVGQNKNRFFVKKG